MTEFGLQIEPALGFEYDQVLALAETLRPNGFASIWASDHFMLNSGDPSRNCMEVWTLLTALASEVKDLRIGSFVTYASYRNPALLAKIAATLDHISGGRLDFGIGSGWKDVEYRAYGYRFPTTGERVSELEESLAIIKSLWTQPTTTYNGNHFSVDRAVAAPKPVQQPGPPVLIGGSRPRILRVMAEYADMVHFLPQPDAAGYAEMLERFELLCGDFGRDPSSIRKAHSLTMLIGSDEDDVERRLARVARSEAMSADEWRTKRSRAFIGTAAQARDLLCEYVDLGVSQFMVVFPFGEEADSVSMFADLVIGEL